MMKTLLSLFIAVIWLSGVQSAEQLTQSDPVVIKTGNSHTLTCKASGFTFSSYYIHWVREIRGKLQWIGYISTDGGNTAYHDDVKGRFTISRDNSNNIVNLKMDNMKTEDTAVYYCVRDLGVDWRDYFDVWGQGTMVTVTSAEKSAPSVFPLVPCCDITSSEITIGCLSTGYLPEPVDVTWNSGSITTGIKSLPGVLNRNGNYISSNYLTISTSNWKSNKYTCNVNHKPSGQTINKDIPECSDPTPASPPTVAVMQGSCGETGSVDLVCLMTGYFPDEIKIQWLLNGKSTSIAPTNSTPYKNSEGKFESRSQVSVPKDDWNSGDTYTCRVIHPPTSTTEKDSIHKCSESSGSLPKVVIMPPSPKDLVITKEAKVTCKVEKLSSTESLEIKWRRQDGKRLQVFTNDPEQEYDGTYTVTSTLRISVADWHSGNSFTCAVAHSDLPAPVEKSIKYRADEEITDPTIFCYQPTSEELAVYDFISLTCLLKGFSPKELYVQWKKNGLVIDEEKYTNTEPILDEDAGTYWMYTRAIVNKSDWNRGSIYTCSGVLRDITSKEIKKNREYFIWENSNEDDEDSLWSTAATFITLFLLSFCYSATITIVKVKWFISRILQLDKVDENFVTVLDSVTP